MLAGLNYPNPIWGILAMGLSQNRWYTICMTTTTYVAFLRGINVGGKNIIKMAELQACLSEAGFANVTTYIQSGNVLFSGPATDGDKLSAQFSAALKEPFSYTAPIAVRSHQQMHEIVSSAPKGFGTQPDLYRYDVLYLIPPLTAAECMQSVGIKEGVDSATAGDSVIYFSRLIARAAQSRLNRIISTPAYQKITIRNWNTTTKLLAMMDATEASRSK